MDCQDLLGDNFVDCTFNIANPWLSFKLKSWFQQCMHPQPQGRLNIQNGSYVDQNWWGVNL